MATIVNARDVLLQAAAARLVSVTLPDSIIVPAVKSLHLTAPALVFQVTNAGVATPASVTLTATLVQISGAVSWSVVSGTATLTGSGSTRTLAYADMGSDSVTIQASVTEGVTTYADQITIAKVRDGSDGADGAAGTRATEGFVYYSSSSSSAPATPSATAFDYTTGAFTGLTAGWSSTFTAPTPSSTAKFWAARYYVTEASFGGAQTISFTSAFNWQNYDGLVSFTNLATGGGATFINGANIDTGTINVNRLTAGSTSDARGSVELLGFSTVLKVTRSGATTLPAAYVYDSSSASTSSLWVASTSSHTGSYTAEFDSASTSGITMRVSSSGAFSGAAKMFNTGTGKEVWLAPGAYAIYSPAGKGKYYFLDGAGPFTGFHTALIPIGVYTPGDIVVDVQVVDKPDVNNAISIVTLSSAASQAGALGVISETRELLGCTEEVLRYDLWWTYHDTHHVADVNGVGEGLINVCGEGGNLAIGDLIVCSSMPGKGMRQTDDLVRSYTVARSREAVTFADPSEVRQIACIYLCG